MLELKNIVKVYELGKPGDKNYQTVQALKGISVEFRKTEFVSILGPSGCGKTTMLNIIGGLDHYTDGDLVINGVSTRQFKDKDWDNYRNHKIGFVFQSYNLIPHQTVLENVELALTLSGVSKTERKKKAEEALKKVGLGDKIHARPTQLSGGQMQRVAIARAIVNDPDIILADEPTGALDTQTSIQIMKLLKEISKEKLIIMVTHNPDLAEEYSTRIIKLLDGEMTDDSRPFHQKDLPLEEVPGAEKKNEGKKEKTSMSFLTALSLSGKNLLTKKARTALVSFAGSIGIIGIALILSLSNGFQSYIDKVQEDTLSTYPLTVNSASMDYSGVIEMFMSNGTEYVEEDENGKIVPNNAMSEIVNRVLKNSNTNNLKAFKGYIEENPEKFEEFTVKYSYGISMDIFDGDDFMQLNPVTVFTDLIAHVIEAYNEYNETNYDVNAIAGSLSSLNSSVYSEMLDNQTLLDSQYELIAQKEGSHWPTNYDECVLVVNENFTLDDYNLYALGLAHEPTLKEIAEQIVTSGGNYEIETSPISYEDVLNKSYRILLPTDYYRMESDGTYTDFSSKTSDADFNKEREAFLKSQLEDESVGLNLKISGIVRPKKNTTATSISTAIGYSSKFTNEYIRRNNASEIMRKQLENKEVDVITGRPFAEKSVSSMKAEIRAYLDAMSYEQISAFILSTGNQQLIAILENGTEESVRQFLSNSIDSLKDEEVESLYQMMIPTSENTYSGNMKKFNNIDIDAPSSIGFYVSDFDAKNELKRRIEEYNSIVKADPERGEAYVIAYTDYVGLMMSSVSTIITAISYVLIAFVSVSLVVSSIMIGIITYISVLERTKEIGVLRSIGASKSDVKHVFTAENLIIGLIAGGLGILVTILLDFPINLIIEHFAEIPNVAQLPWVGAVILIALSCLLTFIAGLIPSRVASKKDPVIALRSE